MNAAQIKAEIRMVRAEMKARGIKRTSCFNGGHSPDSYRMNARLFELETRLKRCVPVALIAPMGWEHCTQDRARAKALGYDI